MTGAHRPATAMPEPRLVLGRVTATRAALDALRDTQESLTNLLRRHAHGDWGDLHPDDVVANQRALRRGLRVLSAYALPTGQHVWILTEADRLTTRVMLADEYRR